MRKNSLWVEKNGQSGIEFGEKSKRMLFLLRTPFLISLSHPITSDFFLRAHILIICSWCQKMVTRRWQNIRQSSESTEYSLSHLRWHLLIISAIHGKVWWSQQWKIPGKWRNKSSCHVEFPSCLFVQRTSKLRKRIQPRCCCTCCWSCFFRMERKAFSRSILSFSSESVTSSDSACEMKDI